MALHLFHQAMEIAAAIALILGVGILVSTFIMGAVVLAILWDCPISKTIEFAKQERRKKYLDTGIAEE